ncbi:SMP-30/gluconolactonase/LRE family protein [Lichenibacterium minor]|uniref:SMP-30/gluconolactonase/LRE family protein n=1 Tax=Lichenibacterium minor TaxID=2316528 RepID=A0A4Q2U7X4_9HYPH|nr:SMP-30/gluconolactonase/LRE family protein [Lichenibacterium minor]
MKSVSQLIRSALGGEAPADKPVPVELLLRAGALNGERPGWDARSQRLFWVDIREPALHMFDPATRNDVSWEMPAWIGCYALDGDGGAMVALATGLYHIRLDTGTLTPFAHSPFDARRFVFNDGRCDPRGRFFGGTMYLPLKPGDMSGDAKKTPLWRYDGGGRWTAVTDPVAMSNGLAWSPDGRTMYHADTEPKTIWAYDYDLDTGTPTNKRVFAQVEVKDASGGPDGATVDSEGFYWSCIYANGEMLRFDPEGRIERRVPLPVKYPTMPALGGPDLKTLFVTSANHALSPEERALHPDEGGLFALEAPVPGVLPNLFSGDYR